MVARIAFGEKLLKPVKYGGGDVVLNDDNDGGGGGDDDGDI